ncbi:MAG: serine/threonine-protein kinase [Thermoanaerobaculia bacterium]|jgi:tRNA A-37 threonylcarbamoyl transferase component Bud32|nr:serine/threonine-protein kinase [Thermoanaerobaculia bacterium]
MDEEATLEVRREAPTAEESSSDGGSAGPTLLMPEANEHRRAQDLLRSRNDRYVLGEPLGAGGMGIVTVAEDRLLGRHVAVKRLRPELASDRVARRLLEEEASLLAAVEHPGTVPVYDAGTLESGEPYYAMKRVVGRTLQELLAARRPEDLRSRESLTHLIDIYERVCLTVAAAHGRGLIHRDIKPSNVMIDELGSIYLMDWGLAVRVGAAEARGVAGTPSYMSPEQARGDVVEPTSDVFSLGVLLYEILTGRSPFSASDGQSAMKKVLEHDQETPFRVNRAAGRALSAVCSKALAKPPAERYPTARDLAAEIRRYREFRPVEAFRPSAGERLSTWARRRPVASSVAVTLFGAVLVGTVVMVTRVATHHALYAAAERGLEEADREIARLSSPTRPQANEGAGSSGVEADLRLDAERRDALRAEAVHRAHGLAFAMIGLGLSDPDPAVQARLRRYELEKIEVHLRSGQDAAAAASLRSALRDAASGRGLGWSTGDVATLTRTLGLAEARLAERRRQGARASAGLHAP